MRTGLARDFSQFKNDFDILFLNSNKFYENESVIKSLNLDVAVCIDWTKDFFIGTDEPFHILHIHPSILPFYRGYGAITEQFLQGVVVSGISVIKNSEHVDAGDILFQENIPIEFEDYPMDFIDKYTASACNFIKTLSSKKINSFDIVRQNEDMGFYLVRKRNKNSIIDFNRDAFSIYNHVRGYSYPFFGAHFYFMGEKYVVYGAAIEAWQGNFGMPGTIICVDESYIDVSCGSGKIRLSLICLNNNEISVVDTFQEENILNI